jgi:hypothetical protein
VRRSLFATVSAVATMAMLGAGSMAASADAGTAATTAGPAATVGTAASTSAGAPTASAGVRRAGDLLTLRATHTNGPTVWRPAAPSTAVGGRPTRPSLRADAVVTADIRVEYSAGFTTQAKAAFQAAVDIWKTQIRSGVPITIKADWSPLGEGVLGQAGPANFRRDFAGAPQARTWYPDALANALAGRDLDPTHEEIDASFNSTFGSWYLGTDGRPGIDSYDFESVVLHELGHGLGFVGTLDGLDPPGYSSDSGRGYWGLNTAGDYPAVFDRFLVDGLGRDALDTNVYLNGSYGLGGLVRGSMGGTQWKGASGVIAGAGARPKLYSPTAFESGSSVSHLDENSYPAGSANALMTPYLQNGESEHDPGPIVRGMFTDMGWGAVPCTAAVGTTTGRFVPSDTTSRGTFAMTGGVPFDLPMTGTAGIPSSGVSAVLATLEVTSPSASGYLMAGSGCGGSTASAQQYRAGVTRSALVSLPLDSQGRMQVRLSAGAAKVSVYVHGWYAASTTGTGLFRPIVKTRAGSPVVRPGAPADVATTGVGGLPGTGVDAVLLNVTVVNPTAAGALFVSPGGTTSGIARQYFAAGRSVSQLVVVPRSSAGTVRIALSGGTATVLVDVWGYYGATASSGGQVPHEVAPRRVLNASTAPDVTFSIPGLPAGTRSVVLVATVTGQSANGYLAATAGGSGFLPGVVQYYVGDPIANLVVVPVGLNNTVRLRLSAGTGRLYADLLGYAATS